MPRRALRRATTALMLLLSTGGLTGCWSAAKPLDQEAFDALYATPLPPVAAPLSVYHLGHSLVGRDMPVMLRQLADAGFGPEGEPGEPGHRFHSQLGWGAPLKAHWEPDVPVNGFAEENTHAEHRDPHAALASGAYGAVVLTEAVEIRDAIKYQDSATYLAKWAAAAWEGNPEARVYLYETWHGLDGAEDWLARLDGDLPAHWEGEILRVALARATPPRAIYVIPAGQVMAAFVRKVEAAGGIGAIATRADLFTDDIHVNDAGAYLVALTHYAVLYGRSPVGLPHALTRADGTPFADPGPEAAAAMQAAVWEVVTGYPPTGVAPR